MSLSNHSLPLCLHLTPDRGRLTYHKYMTSMSHLPVSDEIGGGEGERGGGEGGGL